jgi:hypothetical protein
MTLSADFANAVRDGINVVHERRQAGSERAAELEGIR